MFSQKNARACTWLLYVWGVLIIRVQEKAEAKEGRHTETFSERVRSGKKTRQGLAKARQGVARWSTARAKGWRGAVKED